MTAFFKVSGAGNDFVALAEPAADPGPEQIQAWCRRGISLGADGVFTLRRSAPGERKSVSMKRSMALRRTALGPSSRPLS